MSFKSLYDKLNHFAVTGGKKMGKKYFISDTHIGERGDIDDFGEKEEYFCSLLAKIAEENTEDDPGELILLGDFFDFLEVSTEAEKPKNVPDMIRDIITKIESRYQKLFPAVRDFIKAKQKIFYVCGNHDYYMLFPRIYHMVAEKMIPGDGMRLSEGYRLFQVSDYYISRKYKIYAEHGHRFDPENWHHNGMPECLGSLLVKNFLIKWEETYKELDNLRPRGNMYYLIKENSTNPAEKIKEMLEDMNDVHGRYLTLCGQYNFTHSAVYNRHGKIKKLLSVFGKSDWLDKVVLWMAEGSIVDALNENCTIYRDKAKELMDMSREDNIANEKDLDFQPEHFIFGHTHFFDHVVLEGGKTYFNTASWLNTLFYDEEENQVRVDDIIARTPVLVFPQSGEDPSLFEITASGGMSEIDCGRIKERYKNIGVVF